MSKVKRIGIYPGSFDPITFGHIDLIERALEIFDEVIVAVAPHGTEKKPLFSIAERISMIKQSTTKFQNVSVEPFEGLVVDFAEKKKAQAMIRGIRMLSDFEYEFQMALTNRKLKPTIETIFLMPHESFSYLSSRLLKEIAMLDGNIESYAPEFVIEALKKKVKASK